jgi:hypothetical protein
LHLKNAIEAVTTEIHHLSDTESKPARKFQISAGKPAILTMDFKFQALESKF